MQALEFVVIKDLRLLQKRSFSQRVMS